MGKSLNGKELGAGLGQRKDGLFFGRYTDRFGTRKSIYDRSLAEVKRKLKASIRENTRDENVKATYTLDEWFEMWMRIYKQHLRESTKYVYESTYQLHIKPFVGSFQLASITSLDLQETISQLKEEGIKSGIQNKVKVILSDMFKRAIENNIVNNNPAKSLVIDKKEKIERVPLTTDQQREFFAAAKGTIYENAYLVQVLTGIRSGELRALNWKTDIDFEKQELKINKTLCYDKRPGDDHRSFYLTPPKTKASIRKVKFDQRCAAVLKQQIIKKKQLDYSHPNTTEIAKDLLFVSSLNTPITPYGYYMAIKHVVDLINRERDDDEEKFPDISSHIFRHTYATRCFEAGVEPKTVQKQLGHSTLEMTMDIYTHVLEDQLDVDIDKFSRYTNDIL